MPAVVAQQGESGLYMAETEKLTNRNTHDYHLSVREPSQQQATPELE